MTTYTFRFDGQTFTIEAIDKLNAMRQANTCVRAAGVTDSFAWFEDRLNGTSFTLNHNVLMD